MANNDGNKQLLNTFPDPLAKDSEKKTVAYGLKVALAIASDWFNGGYIIEGCEYYRRRDWIEKLRLASKGKQDLKLSKDLMSRIEEDLSFLNIDWRNLNLAGKFINVVTGGINEKYFQVDVSAVDKLSNDIKSKYKEELEKDMYAKDMLNRAYQQLGIDLRPKGFVPENEEELNMHLDLEYKPAIEIVEEILINYVKQTNNWENIKSSVDYDLAICGIGAVRCYTDKRNGVVLDYIDVENLIHSYCNRNDFKDVHYYGDVETITISELKRSSDFSESTLRDIAEQYATVNGNTNVISRINYRDTPFDNLLDHKVDIMNFSFQSSKTIVYKKTTDKHSGIKMNKKDEDYDTPETEQYGSVNKILNTWYEGVYVVGTNYIYNYKECENLVHDELDRAMPPYIVRATDIYKNQLHSFMEDIEPLVSQMQLTHLKIQQLIAETRPDPIEVDIDLLAELDNGKGGKSMDWKQALALFNAKGVLLTTRVNLGEDGMKDRPALRYAPSQQSSKLPALLNAWAHYYNLIREITGINPFRDGTQPSDALVGVQEAAVMASNTATNYIVKASMDISKTACERISSRLTDIFKYSDLKKVYKRVIGKQKMELLESLKDRHLHEFGFTIKMLPTEAEFREFKESLMMALQEGSITVDDKMKAESLAKGNIKQAIAFLSYRRKKTLEQKRKDELENIQAQSQSNAQAAQAAEAAKVQSYQMQAKIDVEKEQMLSMIRVKEQQAMNQVNAPEKAKEFQFEIYKEQIRKDTEFQKISFAEEQKDKRQDRNNTQQSQLIDQRTKDTPPVDFENQFDINKEIEEYAS